jgi:hypothetical protein
LEAGCKLSAESIAPLRSQCEVIVRSTWPTVGFL